MSYFLHDILLELNFDFDFKMPNADDLLVLNLIKINFIEVDKVYSSVQAFKLLIVCNLTNKFSGLLLSAYLVWTHFTVL